VSAIVYLVYEAPASLDAPGRLVRVYVDAEAAAAHVIANDDPSLARWMEPWSSAEPAPETRDIP
jgi:hypothetical protein